jgi:hypothetical protein
MLSHVIMQADKASGQHTIRVTHSSFPFNQIKKAAISLEFTITTSSGSLSAEGKKMARKLWTNRIYLNFRE